jgi:hypothetical protein
MPACPGAHTVWLAFRDALNWLAQASVARHLNSGAPSVFSWFSTSWKGSVMEEAYHAPAGGMTSCREPQLNTADDSHEMHLVPLMLDTCPVAQSRHPPAPSVSLTDPAGQGTHAGPLAVSVWKVPRGQGVQLRARGSKLKNPDGQSTHRVRTRSRIWPPRHDWQRVRAASGYRPSSHCWHRLWPGAGCTVPPGHAWHASTETGLRAASVMVTSVIWVPGSHSSHRSCRSAGGARP